MTLMDECLRMSGRTANWRDTGAPGRFGGATRRPRNISTIAAEGKEDGVTMVLREWMKCLRLNLRKIRSALRDDLSEL